MKTKNEKSELNLILESNSRLHETVQKLYMVKKKLEIKSILLNEEITEREHAEVGMKERMKELEALYGLSEIVERKGITLDELYQAITEFLPSSWQYPEICSARITIDDKEFRTENYVSSNWKQTSNIVAYETVVGNIEVNYLEDKPFLKGERLLLDALGERLGRITERKMAEEKTYQLSKLSSESPNPIISITNNKKIIYVNNAAAKVLDNENLQTGFSFNLWTELIDEAFVTKTVKNINETKIKNNYFSWMLVPIKEKGWMNIYGVDITDRKLLEELALSQKIEAIGQLAGGIAHDFNNIIMGILGNISLAKIKFPKAHPGYKYLEDSEKSINRATSLTGKLLTFSTEGGPIKENIRFSSFIQEIVRFGLSGSNILPVFDMEENLWELKADKGQIHQVFSNLIINAKQAMPKGGTLYIMLKNVDISKGMLPELNQGRYIKATVRDEGAGIAPKHLKQVFNPFFTTKEFGRGLGLATAYSIIKKHNGHINFDSKLGKGTTFTIYLPASETQPVLETKQPETTEYSIFEHIDKILMMDDEENICTLLTETLQIYGFSISTASDGKQAIEMYKKSLDEGEPFDVVILDLTIPGGMGGKETVKELLKINQKAKCIVSSGYANDPIMSNYAEYGFKADIIKPYTPNSLLKVLSQVLENN